MFFPQVIITGDYNYSDPVTQGQIETLMQTLENTSYITTPLYSESWLRSFVSYVDRNNDYLNLTIDSEQSFIDALREVCISITIFNSFMFLKSKYI